MSIRTPNYVVSHDITISTDKMGFQKVLPSGAFVRPIHKDYLPKHVLEKHKDSLSDYYVMCYCYFGLIPIPKSYLREV